MDKLTYLAELAEGLARWVPERERQDILRYYAEYFDEAGPDKEGQVVAELGDPWALSCRLAVEGGYVTQEKADSWTPPKKKRWPWVLIATVACVAIVAVSVARTAAQFGGWIGRLVSSNTANVAQVEEGTAFAPGDQPGGFWSMEDGYLEAFDEIDIDASIGNVTVTGGEDFTLSISSDATLGGYSLQWEVKDGVLKIRDGGSMGHVEINNWDDFKNIFGVNASAMDVGITVPEQFMLTKVEIKTDLGDVFLSDLDVEKKLKAETSLGDVECYTLRAYDSVELKSGLGDVECYGLRAQKKAELKTGAGDVALGLDELLDGLDIEVKTGAGQIDASLNCPERDCRYEAKSGLGTVTVDGVAQGSKATRGGSTPYKLELSSGTGDISLSFQDG